MRGKRARESSNPRDTVSNQDSATSGVKAIRGGRRPLRRSALFWIFSSADISYRVPSSTFFILRTSHFFSAPHKVYYAMVLTHDRDDDESARQAISLLAAV